MEKHVALLLLICSGFLTPIISQESDFEIFRYVNLNKDVGQINLGDPITNWMEYTYQENGNTYLQESFFGGADAIQLITNEDGKIKSIAFRYNENTTMTQLLIDYFPALGNPELVEGGKAWNDRKTEFKLYYSRYRGKSILFSKITDLSD